MQTIKHFFVGSPIRIAMLMVVVAVLAAEGGYAWYLQEHMAPNTSIGAVSVGLLSRDQAGVQVQEAVDRLIAEGIRLDIEGKNEVISPDDIALNVNIGELIETAWQRGHNGLADGISAMLSSANIDVPVRMDDAALSAQLADIASLYDLPMRDVRLGITGTTVRVLTDTKPGRMINRTDAAQRIRQSLAAIESAPITLTLEEALPQIDSTSASAAANAATHMIAQSITLTYQERQFFISRERIGSWITSAADGQKLVAQVDRTPIAAYVTTIAKSLNVSPEPPQVNTQDGRVVGFTPPKVGMAVQETELVDLIIKTLTDRSIGAPAVASILIPVSTTKSAIIGLDAESGITEIVGKATTPFTGSPRNRILNIKNGVKFVTGSVLKPGEEFSTLNTLGVIDNSTGYLPELVIKGDRTTPEYGGGLCQVSTTLFRAVLNAGLPVTSRRNHSYRVSYYEKDGTGAFIGPGLDATIYEPDLDFKFRNDTAHSILIIGYVIGDKVTFELYGTKDGRTAQVIGPKLLTETSPGEPVYIETTEIPAGTVKQVEQPHPGGSTIASYTVTYPDGHKNLQEFKSYYRRWPAKFLKGVPATAAILPAIAPTPTVTP